MKGRRNRIAVAKATSTRAAKPVRRRQGFGPAGDSLLVILVPRESVGRLQAQVRRKTCASGYGGAKAALWDAGHSSMEGVLI